MDFWKRREAWEEKCREELREKGYNPDEWDVTDDGSIYLKEDAFVHARRVVTPWED